MNKFSPDVGVADQQDKVIEGPMPSPAEPLRVAAREARARGELDVAASLLVDATELDPANETVQLDLAEIQIEMKNVEAARTILDAHELALAHDYRPALEQLLEIVRRDRGGQKEAARKAMLDIFTLLGADPRQEDLLREFRIQLARILN